MPEFVFRNRGVILAGPLLVGVLSGRPGSGPMVALLWIALGLGLRAWSFVWLGGRGRTRSPAPPPERVVGGPYRWLAHPVYVANLLVAGGFALALEPPAGVAVALMLTVGLVYAVLAAREEQQLADLAPRSLPAMGLAAVARSERSTWITVALVLVAAWF